jgi:hypothetical protein
MGGRLRRQPSPDSRLNSSLHPNEAMDTFGERTIGRMRRAVKHPSVSPVHVTMSVAG